MISGFNTDIECDGVVYHVQTEDKGLSAKKIISLVYVGGTILASKRSPYDDLAAAGFNESALAERLQKQHRLICAAVKAGRIEDLKEMSVKASVARSAPVAHAVAQVLPAITPDLSGVVSIATSAELYDKQSERIAKPLEPIIRPVVTPIPTTAKPAPAVIDAFADAPIIEDVSVVDEVFELPADAVTVVSELSGRERPTNSKLGIEILGDSKFKGGDRHNLQIMVCRGTERKVVPGAQILVKVLGSAFRPVIFHAASDGNGLARIHLQLPHFHSGRAALLIRAMHIGEETELRRAVTPG